MFRSTTDFRRAGVCLLSAALALLVLLPARTSSAQANSPLAPTLPAAYTTQILDPAWRAALPPHPAFGSLCSLGPLACALIDRPFALNARLDLVIHPKAPDGSTGVSLPFAVSVPLFGRAEVGLGSCYAGFWASKEEAAQANADPAIKRPSGLCPFSLAAKLILFPWFRDPHTHPALAVEYQFEVQAGPFGGVNQLGLPGSMSKLSLAYRHPLGRMELGAAVSVLVDHASRAGTLQFGPHFGYRLPVGEHFWIFGQAIVQAPSWGPIVWSETPGQTLNLAPPVAGTLAVGAQQRADFGFGAGLTLMVTKSEIETRVDFLFRLLSFEVGPHIKPLIPAREKRDEPPKVAVGVKPQATPQLECPPGYQVEFSPPAQPTAPDGLPTPGEPKCVPPAPRFQIPSPLWGKPCYLAPIDGSSALRMGNIDSTGQYCEWDGVRLPLGAVIEPPQRLRDSEIDNGDTAAPSSQMASPGTLSAPAVPTAPGVAASAHSSRRSSPARVVATAPPSTPTDGEVVTPSSPTRQDHIERVEHIPPSVSGSPLASGFVDGAKESYQHLRDLYQAIKKHGPGVVLPSSEAVEEWVKEVEEQCLERLDECAKNKAREAAAALNNFRKKPWDDKKYTMGHWSWSAVETMAETAALAVLPGGGAVVRVGEKAAAEEALKGAALAAVRQKSKEAAEAAATKKAAEAEAKRVAEAEVKRAAEEAAGRTPPQIHAGKQGKHIPGDNNFIPGRSELTHPDPQGLLDRHAGTGVKHGNKEVVDFGEPIGNNVTPDGVRTPTTRGTIHYGGDGKTAHIVPAKPNP